MTLCRSKVTKDMWHRFFGGQFEDYILETESGSFSVLCPKHCHLVGKLPKDGAHEAVSELLELKAKGEKVKKMRLDNLSKDLWSSREDGDFTIECEGKSFRVHSNLFAAASPVFKVMLGTNLSEARTSRLVIADSRFDDVESALRFAYTGELEDNANVYGVVRIADKYEMDELVKLCCMRILAELSVQTVADATRALRQSERATMAAAFEVLVDTIAMDNMLCRAALAEL